MSDTKMKVDNATEVQVDDQAVGSMEDGLEFGEDLLSEFGSDFSEMEQAASISEDLSGFAKGFPDWDLHPPKK